MQPKFQREKNFTMKLCYLVTVLMLSGIVPAFARNMEKSPDEEGIVCVNAGGECRDEEAKEGCEDPMGNLDCPKEAKCCRIETGRAKKPISAMNAIAAMKLIEALKPIEAIKPAVPIKPEPPVTDGKKYCWFGRKVFKHGDLVMTFPIKCLQLTCNKGIIEPRHYDKPEDCGCCEFNGKIYKNDEKITGICTDMTCHDGKWVTKGWYDKCCGYCTLRNDPHITTFDSYYYHWHGTCNYSISQFQSSYDSKFGIYGKFRQCNTVASCIDTTTFVDNPNTVIQIQYNGGHTVLVNNQPYNVQNFVEAVDVGNGPHNVLAWQYGNCNMFLGSQGYLLRTCRHQVFVWAYPSLVNQVNGLCGHYNRYKPDDFTNRNGNVHTLHPYPNAFPVSWRTNDQAQDDYHCGVTRDVFTIPETARNPCNEHAEGLMLLTEQCHKIFGNVESGPRFDLEGFATSKPSVLWKNMSSVRNNAIKSCVADICILRENNKEEIQAWMEEMKNMLKEELLIERHTTEGAIARGATKKLDLSVEADLGDTNSEDIQHSEDSGDSVRVKPVKIQNLSHSN